MMRMRDEGEGDRLTEMNSVWLSTRARYVGIVRVIWVNLQCNNNKTTDDSNNDNIPT